MKCYCVELRELGGFDNFEDYEYYKKLVLKIDFFSPVEVKRKYAGVGGLDEYWFKCNVCGRTWRLVEPDPPFVGMWGEVE